MEEYLKLFFLALLGVLAGFINIFAGGGSLLTLPFLIFMGLPPNMANGTNRIAIFIQNIFAVAKFKQLNVIPGETIWITTLPAIAGSLIGANIAVDINEVLFKRILAIVMIMVMGFIFFGKKKPTHAFTGELSLSKKVLLVISFFVIGIYGGFIQAGVGFLLITALTATGYDLVKTNALKVLVVLAFTPFALMIFIMNGQVNFLYGFVLAIGNSTGAIIATKMVVEKGHNFIRWIVIAAVTVFAIKLFFG